MAFRNRRHNEKYKTRQKILDAARQLVTERGYGGLTMRKLAARIEYSPTVIYAHFRDKETLLGELVVDGYSSLSIRIGQHATTLPPLRRLRLIAGEFVKFALENPNRYSIIANCHQAKDRQPISGEVEHNGHRPDINSVIFRTVCEAIHGKFLCSHLNDAELVSQIFFAGIHGVITMCLGNGDANRSGARLAQERVDLMIDLLLHGLGNCQNQTSIQAS